MARSSPRKRPTVNYNEDADIQPKKESAASKALSKLKSVASKVGTKRKADHEPTNGADEKPKIAEAKPAPKKRKTAKEKEEDAMPLVERTAIEKLPKAMYIGAHVSAAGGMYLTPSWQ